MFMLMLFMLFFLIASIAMFIFIVKKMDANYKNMSDEHAQLRVLLRAMESRLDHMEKYLATGRALNAAGIERVDSKDKADDFGEQKDESEYDPLLHLSFEEPRRGDAAPDAEMMRFMDSAAKNFKDK